MFPFAPTHSLRKRPDSGGWACLTALVQRCLTAFGRGGAAASALEHLGSMPLTAQASLALVRLNGETLLLGVTAKNITLIARSGGAAQREASE